MDGVSVAAEFADSNLHTSLTMTFIHYICAREHCFFFFFFFVTGKFCKQIVVSSKN